MIKDLEDLEIITYNMCVRFYENVISIDWTGYSSSYEKKLLMSHHVS